MSDILRYIQKSPIVDIRLGMGFIILGFSFVLIGVLFQLDNFVELGKYIVPLGLGVLSVGLAVDSSEKIKSISNAEFLQVVNMLEDARIEFNKTLLYIDSVNHPNKYKIPIHPGYSPETFTWKTKNCIEMAVELLKRDEKKKYIEPDYQDKLFHYYNMSFNHFFKFPNWKKEKKSLKHIITSYAMLEEYYNKPRKEEFEKALGEKLGKDKKTFLDQVEEAKKNLDEVY